MAEEWTWYIWATVGTLASIVSVAFWKRIKARRHRQDEDKLLQGRFGKRVAQVRACARKTEMESEKKPAASVLSGWCPMRGAGDEGTDAQDSDGELDTTYPEEDIDALNDAVNRHGTGDLETNVAGMQRLDKLTQELQEDEVSYSLDELGELHGKLMTADLRNKAKKYEAQMTEEQRQSEAEIRQQQLESIFALMQQQQDKFGSPNEGDIVEQMKLYAL